MNLEQWKHARKNIAEFKPRRRGVVARYAIMQSDGTMTVSNNNACHAGLGYRYKDKDPICVINELQVLKTPDETAALRFYEWMFNYSPYRSAFITKSPRKVLERDVFLATTEVPANIMVGGLMASRLATEYHSIGVWDKLVKEGVHPNAAFALAHSMTTDEKFKTVSMYDIGHTALYTPGERLDETFWNFLRGKPLVVDDIYREKKSYDYNINKTWYGTPKRGQPKFPVTDLRKRLTTAMQKTKANKTTNPFAPQATGNTFPFNEALEEIALDMKNIIAMDNKLAA